MFRHLSIWDGFPPHFFSTSHWILNFWQPVVILRVRSPATKSLLAPVNISCLLTSWHNGILMLCNGLLRPVKPAPLSRFPPHSHYFSQLEIFANFPRLLNYSYMEESEALGTCWALLTLQYSPHKSVFFWGGGVGSAFIFQLLSCISLWYTFSALICSSVFVSFCNCSLITCWKAQLICFLSWLIFF